MNLYVISGVTGMTGSELARQLLRRGDRVVGFDNFFASSLHAIKDLLEDKSFDFFEYDLNDREQMSKIADIVSGLKGETQALVYVNCAAVVHTEHFYHVESTFETNVLGMRAFLGQAIRLAADIFINCSTSEVYSMNSWKEGGVSEHDYLTLAHAEHSQRTSYATGKLLTEFFLKEAVEEKQIRGCSIRFANVYSKKELYAKHIIPHILNSLKTAGRVELLENSKQNYRTFLHNTDSCSAVIALMDTLEALDGTVYNVSTDEEISILDLVALCAGKMGIVDPTIVFQGYRESDPVRRLLNTEKIRRRTGWAPEVTLSMGIDMCLEEMKD